MINKLNQYILLTTINTFALAQSCAQCYSCRFPQRLSLGFPLWGITQKFPALFHPKFLAIPLFVQLACILNCIFFCCTAFIFCLYDIVTTMPLAYIMVDSMPPVFQCFPGSLGLARLSKFLQNPFIKLCLRLIITNDRIFGYLNPTER